MAYLAPIHQPSSVRHALKLNFLKPDEECLVVAKANRLEFYSLTQDGLLIQHSQAIYGKVSMLNKLRPASSPTDHLFVGTDRFMYFTLSWNAEKKQLHTETSYVDQADRSTRDSQTGERSLIDPSGRFMTLELYEGVITVLPIAQKLRKKGDPEFGSLRDPIPSRIPELFVRSSTFIRSKTQNLQKDKPVLALLYEDAHRKVRLKLRHLTYYPGSGSGDPGTVDFEDTEGLRGELELGASHLIPVAAPAGGLLVLGETSITYFDPSSQDTIHRPLEAATIFVTWEQIDKQRFIIADEYGKLYLLMLNINGQDHVDGWKLDVIGETSRAGVLTYLDAGTVFVGSHQGDSQVIMITPQNMEVVQTFPNVAPILDFSIMDMGSREGQTNEYSSGQARLVTGSGAFKDGSLRSVRSGVGLEELGLLGDMENITNMFSLRSSPLSPLVDVLVVSFVDETRIFAFGAAGAVEELRDFKNFSLGGSTVYSANSSRDGLIQVTESVVSLIDVGSGMIASEWRAPAGKSITAATHAGNQLIVTVAGTILVVLNIGSDSIIPGAFKEYPQSNQIACVTTSPVQSGICVVGFWQSSAISVLDMETLQSIATEQPDDADVSVPRSMVVARLLPDQDPVLFVAMADGTVVTYTLNTKTGHLSGRKAIVLGTQQASFRVLPREDGLDNVFAACEQPSMIYGSEGRIVFSAVTAEDASAVCPFDAESYRGAIAIATRKDLKIALVDEERTTHVQGLHVGETVRRIAYSSELKAFGLGTIKRTLLDGVEIVQSHFKLTDEVMFNVLHSYPLNEDELIESVMRAPLNDGSGGLAERFVVGTAYLDDECGESVRGRILVLEVTEDRQLKLVFEQAVKGACRCLSLVDGNVVAALVKTVVVYSFEYETPSKPFFVKTASYRTSTAPIDLAVTGNIIAIADLMKSISIVHYKRSQGGRPAALQEVARHFQTSWSTAVAVIEENTFLQSDAEGNLIVLNQDVKGVTADDRRRLQVTSELLLGEMVNRIRPISVPTSPDAVVIPRAFLATVEGSIYLFASIAPSKQDLLMRLQTNMANFVHSPGNVPFNKYRAFRSLVREADEPFRFVDGELIERFLDCAPEVQKGIVEGLAMDVEQVKSMVEGLRRLR